MKITCSVEHLLNPLHRINAAISKAKSTLPILNNILIKSVDDGVQFTGTDMQMSMRVSVSTSDSNGEWEVYPDAVGEILFPLDKIKLLKLLPPESVIELDGSDSGKVRIKCGQKRYSYSPPLPADFPFFTAPQNQQCKIIVDEGNSSAWLRGLKMAKVSAARNDVRYYLMGINLSILPDSITLIGTNGHRLSYARIDQTNPAETEMNISAILPIDCAEQLIELMSKSQRETIISLCGDPGDAPGRVYIQSGDTEIVSSLIAGQYPNCSSLIAKAYERGPSIDVDRREILQAIERVSLFSDYQASTDISAVQLLLDDDLLHIESATSNHDSDAREEITLLGSDIQGYSPPNSGIGYRAAYLSESVTSLDADIIRIAFFDAGALRLTVPDDDNRMVYIMPMRV